jgi:uncharacterized membrane protein YebE (DUF533 family)
MKPWKRERQPIQYKMVQKDKQPSSEKQRRPSFDRDSFDSKERDSFARDSLEALK